MGFLFAKEIRKNENVDILQQQFKYKTSDLEHQTEKKGLEFSLVLGEIGEYSRPDPSCKINFQGNGGTGQGQLTYTEEKCKSYQHAGLLIEAFNGPQMKQFLFEVTYINYTQAIVWMRPFDNKRFPNKKEFLFCIVLDELDLQDLQIINDIQNLICTESYDYNTILHNSQNFVKEAQQKLKNYFQQYNIQVIIDIDDRIKKD